jgi:hypothetical protein
MTEIQLIAIVVPQIPQIDLVRKTPSTHGISSNYILSKAIFNTA